ncbi:transcription factor MYB3R-5-like [Silene latifolia]|uniref:transcription factor MYB3R-5-like n=1 Tax=Silene latifolia TaxID=37657 RepID=UPI003D78828A
MKMIEVKEENEWSLRSPEVVTISSSSNSCDYVTPKSSSPLLGRTSGHTRRSSKGGWTEEEDNHLTTVVKKFNAKNWRQIAEHFPGRTDVQCLHRWQKVVNPELIKGPWTKEEDDCIIKLVQKHGSKRWSIIAKSLPGRIGKQCRERWHNHLDPAIRKDAWTKEEESLLAYYHHIYGNKWAEIARFLPGRRRTDNAIKNHWNCSLKKKLDVKVEESRLKDYAMVSKEISLASDSSSETCLTELSLGSTPTLSSNPRVDKYDDAVSGLNLELSTRINYKETSQTRMSLESPKRPRSSSFTDDLVFRDIDKSFLSLATPDYSREYNNRQDNKKNKVDAVPGDLIQGRPCFSTPTRCMRSTPTSNGSPESMLRNSAMSFTTPSIIRRSSLKSSSSMGKGIEGAYKSVERCLEASFDKEADLDQIQCHTSGATAVNAVNMLP